jgi:hypothetical protein
VEHSEGKGGESVVAILRFLRGSPHPRRLRTSPFWPRWQALRCVLTTCQVLWGPISRVAFLTTMSNHTSLLRVVLLLFVGRMRSRAKTSSREQGANFDIVGTCVWRVGHVIPLQGVYRFELPRHSRLWVIACHCSHLTVCLMYCWWIQRVGYGYVQNYNIIIYNFLPWTLTWVNVLLVYACSNL